jgi:hypothetical protein
MALPWTLAIHGVRVANPVGRPHQSAAGKSASLPRFVSCVCFSPLRNKPFDTAGGFSSASCSKARHVEAREISSRGELRSPTS